jgi:signal transduction histidine kinase
VDLGEMVRAVARSAVPPDRALEVDVAPDVPMVPGHVDALGRALTNVLLNAVEASEASSPIAIRVQRAARQERSMICLSVEDRGTGISEARLPHIWEPYVTHKAGGTGLGLAIVRQTVLAHDGEVTVESIQGEGTTVRMFLPAFPPDHVPGESND